MEIQSKHVAAVVMQPAPPPAMADMRPSADAAATRQDKTPEIPLPVPPTGTQQALVRQSQLSQSEDKFAPDAPIQEAERTLKPYGVTMLPSREG